MASAAYNRWAKSALRHLFLTKTPQWSGPYPLTMKFFFWRKTRAKFDLGNMSEGCQDVLQQAQVIEDDSMKHVIPVFLGWGISKHNPRVELILEPAPEKFNKVWVE